MKMLLFSIQEYTDNKLLSVWQVCIKNVMLVSLLTFFFTGNARQVYQYKVQEKCITKYITQILSFYQVKIENTKCVSNTCIFNTAKLFCNVIS